MEYIITMTYIRKDYFNMFKKKRFCVICQNDYNRIYFKKHILSMKHIKNKALIENFYKY
jgi:hypothetical protein